MHKEEKDWVQGTMRELLQSLIGAAIALVAAILFLMAASMGIFCGWISAELMDQITAAACFLGALIGGTLTNHGKQFHHGILTGAFLFGLMLIVGTLLYDVRELNGGVVSLAAACLCGGTLSGLMFGKPRKKKTAAGKRKRKTR